MQLGFYTLFALVGMTIFSQYFLPSSSPKHPELVTIRQTALWTLVPTGFTYCLCQLMRPSVDSSACTAMALSVGTATGTAELVQAANASLSFDISTLQVVWIFHDDDDVIKSEKNT